MSRGMTKPSKCPGRSAKTQISLVMCPVWSVFAVHLLESWGSKVSSYGQGRLIRRGACQGWLESLLGVQVILLVLSNTGSGMLTAFTTLGLNEPCHDKTCLCHMQTKKDAGQPVHLQSLADQHLCYSLPRYLQYNAIPKIEPRHEKTFFYHMWTTKVQVSLHIRAVSSVPLLFTA